VATSGHGPRIAILTYGTRGDVEPFVALAAGLRRAGFQPRLAAPAAFASLADAHGIPFQPLPGDLTALAREIVTQAGTNWPRMIVTLSRFIAPLAARAYRLVIELASDADLIVHSFLMTRAGFEIAERQGIPSVSAQFFPVFAPTSSFPAVVFPDLPLGGGYRRLTHSIVTQVFWRGGDLLYRRARKEDPGLPVLGVWPFASSRASRPPILFAFSRHVVPPAPEWAGIAEVTGYWPLSAPPGWSPPVELERFLEQGVPPVYIGLGSGGQAEGGAWIASAIAALEQAGARGVLDIGSDGTPAGRLPPSTIAVGGIPHMWLFPRMAAVVHHGGAGTTGAGLTAGKPTVVIPTASDQPFWGRRVHALNAGPAPIPVRTLSAGKLARAISIASTDAAMKTKAADLGKLVGTEDGVGAAIDRIARALGKRRAS
jgi:UDP:flavonoid glycosyltransferase YjiC (YdhE family)